MGFYGYLAVMNAVSFAMVCFALLADFEYALDKKRAVNNEWRIPERTLLTTTAMGGFVGTYFGMYWMQ